jgi:hypothetical protein
VDPRSADESGIAPGLDAIETVTKGTEVSTLRMAGRSISGQLNKVAADRPVRRNSASRTSVKAPAVSALCAVCAFALRANHPTHDLGQFDG